MTNEEAQDIAKKLIEALESYEHGREFGISDLAEDVFGEMVDAGMDEDDEDKYVFRDKVILFEDLHGPIAQAFFQELANTDIVIDHSLDDQGAEYFVVRHDGLIEEFEEEPEFDFSEVAPRYVAKKGDIMAREIHELPDQWKYLVRISPKSNLTFFPDVEQSIYVFGVDGTAKYIKKWHEPIDPDDRENLETIKLEDTGELVWGDKVDLDPSQDTEQDILTIRNDSDQDILVYIIIVDEPNYDFELLREQALQMEVQEQDVDESLIEVYEINGWKICILYGEEASEVNVFSSWLLDTYIGELTKHPDLITVQDIVELIKEEKPFLLKLTEQEAWDMGHPGEPLIQI